MCVRCDTCSYSASDHNTLRRHHMRHTGHKPYQCAYCPYTAIQAISLKSHMRTRHSAVTSSTTHHLQQQQARAGATLVYSCPSCRYQTVNRRSWLGHLHDHQRTDPASTTTSAAPAPSRADLASSSSSAAAVESASNQLIVVEKHSSGQLLLAPPLVHETTSSAAATSGVVRSAACNTPCTSRPVASVPAPAAGNDNDDLNVSLMTASTDECHLHHLLTAVSNQQHSS